MGRLCGGAPGSHEKNIAISELRRDVPLLPLNSAQAKERAQVVHGSAQIIILEAKKTAWSVGLCCWSCALFCCAVCYAVPCMHYHGLHYAQCECALAFGPALARYS
jgi:hypothetical protein